MGQPKWFPSTSPLIGPDQKLTQPWVKLLQAYLSPANFVDNETPSGLIDGVNTTFTLKQSPNPTGSLLLANSTTGAAILLLSGRDFTLSHKTLTLTLAPALGTALRAWYRT